MTWWGWGLIFIIAFTLFGYARSWMLTRQTLRRIDAIKPMGENIWFNSTPTGIEVGYIMMDTKLKEFKRMQLNAAEKALSETLRKKRKYNQSADKRIRSLEKQIARLREELKENAGNASS